MRQKFFFQLHDQLLLNPSPAMLRFFQIAKNNIQSLASKQQKRSKKPRHRCRPRQESGQVSLTEAMVAGSATLLIVAASAMALRSTETLITRSGDKATLRQNTVNGLRLMRSEIERSIHLVVNSDDSFDETKAHLNINDTRYEADLKSCREQAGNRAFQPVFGAKMVELSTPIFYGVSTGDSGYTILRCGAPLSIDGSYNETESIFLSTVLEDIAALPCTEDNCDPPRNLKDVISESRSTNSNNDKFDYQFTNGFTAYREFQEPALRFETDENYKLIRIVDPTDGSTDPDDKISSSFLMASNAVGATTTQELEFAAFARADKQVTNELTSGESQVLSGAFFKNIRSKKVRFIIDGSGSMSACVMWGNSYGKWQIYFDPRRGYFWSRRHCAMTRMRALQNELYMLLNDLPDDTQIGLRAFSSDGYANHKTWNEFGEGLVRLGDPGVRDSAKAFVQTLDDARPTKWGGTIPWKAIQAAFDDPETESLYFLSDGQPNVDRNRGRWSQHDEQETAEYYSGLNTSRDVNLKVHSTSLGVASTWMRTMSELTGGAYTQVDQDSLKEQR